MKQSWSYTRASHHRPLTDVACSIKQPQPSHGDGEKDMSSCPPAAKSLGACVPRLGTSEGLVLCLGMGYDADTVGFLIPAAAPAPTPHRRNPVARRPSPSSAALRPLQIHNVSCASRDRKSAFYVRRTLSPSLAKRQWTLNRTPRSSYSTPLSTPRRCAMSSEVCRAVYLQLAHARRPLSSPTLLLRQPTSERIQASSTPSSSTASSRAWCPRRARSWACRSPMSTTQSSTP